MGSEEHLILKVGDGIGARLRDWLHGGNAVGLDVAFDAGTTPTLMLDGEMLPMTVTALPTVVESHKSVDGVTFFKTGVIGNVLLADELGISARPELHDGLTQPTVGIRKRMWRKRPVRKAVEVEQVAVELEALRGGSLKAEKELIKVKETIQVPRASLQHQTTHTLKLKDTSEGNSHAQSSLKLVLPTMAMARANALDEEHEAVGSTAASSAAKPAHIYSHDHLSCTSASREAQIGCGAMAAPPPAPVFASAGNAPVAARATLHSAAICTTDMAISGRSPSIPVQPSAVDPAVGQQVKVELERIDAEIAKFEKILRAVSDITQRNTLKAKLASLASKRQAALQHPGARR